MTTLEWLVIGGARIWQLNQVFGATGLNDKLVTLKCSNWAATLESGVPQMRIRSGENLQFYVEPGGTMYKTAYGFGTRIDVPYEKAIAKVKDALKEQGFGVLTEIDVRATLKQKLDVDFPPYIILGACNPPLAHRALTAEREIGLLLPCNVIVYADRTDSGESHVAVMDPEAALALAGNDAIAPLAADVKSRLEKALSALGS